MKRSLIVFFLTLLLVSAALLHANNNNVSFKVKKATKETTKAEVNKDMKFVPDVMVL